MGAFAKGFDDPRITPLLVVFTSDGFGKSAEI